ncbi:MAG: hypothetical protein IEMM0006_0741 [bacterium]|nr:MAG: hypothetical protein IEMM0006_0741 [bacterium]
MLCKNLLHSRTITELRERNFRFRKGLLTIVLTQTVAGIEGRFQRKAADRSPDISAW